jgi:hypothetical protein
MARKLLLRLFVAVFFRLEKMIGNKRIQKNLQQMGYGLKDAQKITNAHRKAVKMCKDD